MPQDEVNHMLIITILKILFVKILFGFTFARLSEYWGGL